MTQQDSNTSMSPVRSTRGRYARMTVAAAAAAAAMVAAAPAVAGAEPIEEAVAAPEAPTLTTAVDGNDLTITLTDPNTSQRLTTCTAALVSVDKAIPLLPDLAAGTLPPLSEIDRSVFAWGPSLTTTNALNRERTYEVADVPTGIYVTLGFCTNLGGVAADYAPTFIGPTLGIGSAVITLGSTVIDTPGAVSAILQLLGIDTGSLGSSDSLGSSAGSLGSADGSLGSSTGSLGSADGSLGSSTGSLGSSTGSHGSSRGSLGSSEATGSGSGSGSGSLGS
ncbi:hypothetical protein [Rhodococcus sp. ACT016]|uniref:hypothetical protein n=1 Tax=Rhodococcus sp. ACT016 TaxID=3134808 RepID=UPI003D26A10F